MRSKDEADCPIRNIVSTKVCRGVRAVEVPTVSGFYGNAAHANGVIRHGDEIHFRFKASDFDGVKLEPCFLGIFIENEIRFVRNMTRNIRRAEVPFAMDERIIFFFVDMDFDVGKICQPANVVEVHVGEDDVLYVFGFVSEFGELIDCRLVRIKWHVGDDTKELREPGGIGIILQTETCIHKGESLIGFDEQTDQSRFPIAWGAGATGKSVENTNGHNLNIA